MKTHSIDQLFSELNEVFPRSMRKIPEIGLLARGDMFRVIDVKGEELLGVTDQGLLRISEFLSRQPNREECGWEFLSVLQAYKTKAHADADAALVRCVLWLIDINTFEQAMAQAGGD